MENLFNKSNKIALIVLLYSIIFTFLFLVINVSILLVTKSKTPVSAIGEFSPFLSIIGLVIYGKDSSEDKLQHPKLYKKLAWWSGICLISLVIGLFIGMLQPWS